MYFDLGRFLLLASFVLLVKAKNPQGSIWHEFPQLWRAVNPLGGTPVTEVSNQRNFDLWLNSRTIADAFTNSLASQKIYDRVRFLLASDAAPSLSPRTTLASLGALGNVQSQVGSARYSFTTLYPEFQSIASATEWYSGTNVCVYREEFDLSKNQHLLLPPSSGSYDAFNNVADHSSSCDFTPDSEAYVCITEIHRPDLHRRYTATYQCCYGFSREPGKAGCPKAIPLTRNSDTLKNLRLTSFDRAMAEAGMSSLLDMGNYTVFAPSNEAFEKLQRSTNNNEVDVRASVPSNNMRATLRSHIVNGLLRSSGITDDQSFDTLDGPSIRINLFMTPTQVFTANCARVISANNIATSGVVHVVDSVLQPVTDTLPEALKKDGRFGSWMALLNDAGLLEELNRPSGQWTLLVPTDDAVRSIDRNIKRRLSNDKTCLKRVLQTHIIPKVICSTVIENTATTKNVLNRTMRFTRTGSDLTVQNQTVLSGDHMTRNGMFFVLADVIIPEEAKSLLEIAADAGLTAFLGMLTKTDLSSKIDEMKNGTIFAPSNRAVEKMPETARRQLGTLGGSMTDALNYLTVQPAVLLSDFKDNLEMSSTLPGFSLRMNIYETFPYGKKIFTVNCAKIVIGNFRGCNGNIHVLDRVLLPPSGNIQQVLQFSGNYTTFLNAMNMTGLDSTLRASGPMTVFAPSDRAFAALAPEDQKLLFTNASLLHSVLQLHILPREMCCAGIMTDSAFFGQYTRSMNTQFSLPLHRSQADGIRIAGSTVDLCDVIATNGVIHTIDKVIFPTNFL
ncbi:hypothetical protein RvY_07241 [Ramazzottius varieornatus]|uniref:FAS1 domain-containing protein n=1 Tax=Ramazzottius varieornatus TaxID=947166 RepID=A0A1D1VAV7_RAMVA|nr:hypothetical protein RvY_07241 [Ramazzottius varieornatus]